MNRNTEGSQEGETADYTHWRKRAYFPQYLTIPLGIEMLED